jgi:hypothetical protein
MLCLGIICYSKQLHFISATGIFLSNVDAVIILNSLCLIHPVTSYCKVHIVSYCKVHIVF